MQVEDWLKMYHLVVWVWFPVSVLCPRTHPFSQTNQSVIKRFLNMREPAAMWVAAGAPYCHTGAEGRATQLTRNRTTRRDGCNRRPAGKVKGGEGSDAPSLSRWPGPSRPLEGWIGRRRRKLVGWMNERAVCVRVRVVLFTRARCVYYRALDSNLDDVWAELAAPVRRRWRQTSVLYKLQRSIWILPFVRNGYMPLSS